MKNSILLLGINLISFFSFAQVVVDSCFSSAPIGITFLSSGDLANADDADLMNWNGTAWQGAFTIANITVPPPCPGPNQRAIFVGDDTQWTTGGEGFALRLDIPLIAGQTYSFTFTYISHGIYSNGSFSPTFSTNDTSVFGSAYLSGNLPPAGISWATNTYTFTAVPAQNNHNWIILHSNTGSGVILNQCSANALSVSLGSDTTICAGDSLLIDAGSGFNGYQWNTGATSQSIYANDSGTYVVTVSNVCSTGSDSVSVHLISCLPGIGFSSSDTSFCDKNCIDFTDLSTNNPTSWQWFFPGADSLSSNQQHPTNICYNSYGSFDVTLIACNAGGCDTLSIPGFINEFQPPPVPVVTSNFDTLFSTPAFSYQWYNSSGAIAGASGPYYIYQQGGSYYVIITDSTGCASSSIVITTGTNEMQTSGDDLIVSPNPSGGTFAIYCQGCEWRHAICEVTDITGRMVYSSRFENINARLQLDLGIAAAGVYLLRINTEKWMIQKRIVISRP